MPRESKIKEEEGCRVITAMFTEWLRWDLPEPIGKREYYQRRGTLYVETEPGSDQFIEYKPSFCSVCDSGAFKRADSIYVDTTVSNDDRTPSAPGVFRGVTNIA